MFGFCGIGNPGAFRKTLESAASEIAGWREFPDHHAYVADDLVDLETDIVAADAAMAVCTQKDLVKLRTPAIGDAELWAVVVEMEILLGERELGDSIGHALG